MENTSGSQGRAWLPLLLRVVPCRGTGTGTFHRDPACTTSLLSADAQPPQSFATLYLFYIHVIESSDGKKLFLVSSFCFPHLPSQGQGDRRMVNSNCQVRSSSSDLRAWWGRDTTENITLQKVRMGIWEMATALQQSLSTDSRGNVEIGDACALSPAAL